MANISIKRRLLTLVDLAKLPFSIDISKYLFIIKSAIINLIVTITTLIYKYKEKIMPKRNKSKEATVDKAVIESKKAKKNDLAFGILGLGLALVFVSNAYMLVVIYLGTSGLTSRIMMAPTAIFELAILAVAFYKIFK